MLFFIIYFFCQIKFLSFYESRRQLIISNNNPDYDAVETREEGELGKWHHFVFDSTVFLFFFYTLHVYFYINIYIWACVCTLIMLITIISIPMLSRKHPATCRSWGTAGSGHPPGLGTPAIAQAGPKAPVLAAACTSIRGLQEDPEGHHSACAEVNRAARLPHTSILLYYWQSGKSRFKQ